MIKTVIDFLLSPPITEIVLTIFTGSMLILSGMVTL